MLFDVQRKAQDPSRTGIELCGQKVRIEIFNVGVVAIVHNLNIFTLKLIKWYHVGDDGSIGVFERVQLMRYEHRRKDLQRFASRPFFCLLIEY